MKAMLKKLTRQDLCERAVQILTVLFFMSIYIFETQSWGSLILFAIGGTVMLFALLRQKAIRPIHVGAYHVFMLVFAAYVLLSALWAWRAEYAVEKASTIVKILLVMAMLYYYYAQERDIFPLVKLLMWACYGIVLYTFVYYGPKEVVEAVLAGGRLLTKFTNVNSLGMLSAFAVIIHVYVSIYDRLRWSALMALPALTVILATGSRKAFLMLFMGIMMIVFLRLTANKSLLKIAMYGGIVLLAGLLALYIVSITPLFSGIWHRIESMLAIVTGEGEVDYSTWLRQEYIKTGFRQFLETPIFGMGIGNPRILAFRDYGTDCYLHNNFVELLAGGGFIGFALFYAMHGYLFFYLLKYRKYGDRNTVICLTMLVLLVFLDYAAVSYYYKSIYFYLMIFFLQVRNLKQQYGSKAHESETTASGGASVSS